MALAIGLASLVGALYFVLPVITFTASTGEIVTVTALVSSNPSSYRNSPSWAAWGAPTLVPGANTPC